MKAPVVRLCGTVVALAALAWATPRASAQAPKQRAVLKGLSYAVDTIAISPDGKLLAAGGMYGGDGELKLWDLTTGKERTNFKGSNQFPHVAFAPDGKTLASCGKFKEGEEFKDLVMFYDPDGKKPTIHLQMDASLHALAYSPDGKLLAVGCADKVVRVWDVASKRPKFDLTGAHTDIIQAVAFGPDSKTIASGGYDDKIICLWDSEKGTQRAVLKGHTSQVRQLAFSPNGKLLASAGWDKSVRLWDPASGEAKATLVHDASVAGVAFSPDGKTLAAAVPFAEKIVLWDLVTGKEKATLKTEARPNRVAHTPDGNTLVAGMSDSTIILWELPAR
jgi:WD40 repeat protein